MDSENLIHNLHQQQQQNFPSKGSLLPSSNRAALGDITNNLLSKQSKQQSSDSTGPNKSTSKAAPNAHSTGKASTHVQNNHSQIGFLRRTGIAKKMPSALGSRSSSSGGGGGGGRTRGSSMIQKRSKTGQRMTRRLAPRVAMTRLGFGILEDGDSSSSKNGDGDTGRKKTNMGKRIAGTGITTTSSSSSSSSGNLLNFGGHSSIIPPLDEGRLFRLNPEVKQETNVTIQSKTESGDINDNDSDNEVEFMHKDDTDYEAELPILLPSFFDEETGQHVQLQVSVAQNKHKVGIPGDILSTTRKKNYSLSGCRTRGIVGRTRAQSQPDRIERLSVMDNDSVSNAENIDPQTQQLSTGPLTRRRRSTRISIGKASAISKIEPAAPVLKQPSPSFDKENDLDWSSIDYKGVLDDFSFPSIL